MDKKELNDLIDRVALTGPGGVDKVKKILKELANGSGSSGCDCPGAMFVHGTISEINDELVFTQNGGEPLPAAAKSHIEKGGTLYIIINTPADNYILPFSGFSSGDSLLLFQNSFNRVSIYWHYAPDTDFSVSVDYNNPDIGNTSVTKAWSTQLDESTIGDAEVCGLFIDNYNYGSIYLQKRADGLFTTSVQGDNWGLMSRELALNRYSWDIPETVKYVVVCEMQII